MSDALALAGLAAVFLNCVWNLAETAKQKYNRRRITARYYEQNETSE